MSIQSDRLKQARISAGFETATDAAASLGISPPTYAAHENGSRGISAERAARYARAFRVEPEWILYGASTPPDVPAADDLVAVYDVRAGAGPSIVVYDEAAVAQLAFPPGYLSQITRTRPNELAIISVKGDSMLPTLADDDVVMIDRTKKDLSFDGLFVLLDGGNALLVKRIGRASRAGYVSLISDNRALYPAVERSLQDIEVVGRVIWRGGKV
jgi:phage repressor protein C with HTH and peptisase S24 domain